MKTSFFSRFLGFSLAFYVGSVVAVFILTVVKTATLFPVHFWRWLTQSTTIKFGLACGAFSYAIAYFFTILVSMGGTLAQSVTSLNLIEYSLLGLPVVLVLLSRHFAWQNVQA